MERFVKGNVILMYSTENVRKSVIAGRSPRSFEHMKSFVKNMRFDILRGIVLGCNATAIYNYNNIVQ